MNEHPRHTRKALNSGGHPSADELPEENCHG